MRAPVPILVFIFSLSLSVAREVVSLSISLSHTYFFFSAEKFVEMYYLQLWKKKPSCHPFSSPLHRVFLSFLL